MSSMVGDIEMALRLQADERHAAVLRSFFKTAPGDYGEGDRILGVTNPRVREVVRHSWRHTSLGEAAELVHSHWHEVRMCGLLILVAHFERAMKAGDLTAMHDICNLYLSLHPHINNWDLVDLTAYKIVGRYELLTGDFARMDEWITPGHTLWQRRMAMVATWMHARHGRYDRLTTRAQALLTARHDLLHKAAGWMLREMHKHDELGRDTLLGFLETHVREMPQVMLSYATEKMTPAERARWRARRRGEALTSQH